MVGTAKAANLQVRPDQEVCDAYRADQRAAILRALDIYNPTAMVVFNVDLGHTDPQWIIPYGGRITVDGPGRRVVAHY